MAQALYRKWRPQTFDEVVAQEHVVRTLRNALRTGHVHHAYLFAGPRGTGKTTSARLIAKAVNCLAPVEERPCNECQICQAVNEGRLMDLIEIDAASHTGVDNVREILEKVGFRPTQARFKVYVVDEVHMLSTAAFNALLKTLEEPPEHVLFVLATTEVHKIPATVLSRCQRFEFRRIPLDGLVSSLKKIAAAEGIEAEAEALELIARAATGSMRDAISLLDQMASEGAVSADYVRTMLGAERREVVLAVVEAWLQDDLSAGLATLNHAVDSGADPRQLARQIADFLRGLLLMRLGAGETWAEPTSEERPRLEKLARSTEAERLVRAVRLFSDVASERTSGWQPQLPLELAFVEATFRQEAAPVKQETTAPRAPAGAKPAPSQVASPSRAEPQAKPQTKAAAPPEGDVAVAFINEHWHDVINQMRRVDLSLSALLNDARPVGIDSSGMLVLGFRHKFHRNQVNNEENLRTVDDLLSQMFKRSLRSRCVLAKEWSATQVPGATAPQKAAKPQAKTSSDKGASEKTTAREPEKPNDPLQDEVVQRAVNELGAVPKVVE
ncbi:MAG: DNA polymerase III subunit gamma/tau [Anaerolineales bacterium]